MDQPNKLYLDMDQIKSYLKLISVEYELINKLEQQINKHKQNIKKIQNILIQKCKHNKVIDNSCSYDRTTFCCDICYQDL